MNILTHNKAMALRIRFDEVGNTVHGHTLNANKKISQLYTNQSFIAKRRSL